ncbi:MAG: M6 family metalloprotease domain-containing protein [Paludibacter sp.]
MKNFSFFVYLSLTLIFSVSNLYAVPATPYPVKITQPDGSEITIRLHGNEFFHYKTTLDGYLLVPDSKGVLTYARMDSGGKLLSTNVKANNIERRLSPEKEFVKNLNPNINFNIKSLSQNALRAPSANSTTQPQKSFPLTGSPKSLVILVNFKDKSFVTTSPQTAFTNLLNQSGYSVNSGTGSARDYFMSSTYGKFSPDFDVVGPVTLPQTLDFYGKNDTDGNDTNAVQMIVDACTQANAAGLDFTQYDTDNDGVLDNVFVYYAGYNEAEGAPANTIWPHRWGVYPGSNYSGTVASITFDGKRLLDYACTSELKGTSNGTMCGIGTFCHEFGHVLGLVDYYDTSGKQSHTLDSWDIMDAGAYNNGGRTPPTYSAFDRFFLGYLTPQQVSSPSHLTLLPIYQGETQIPNTNNQAFLLSASTHNLIGNNPNPKEFFLLEYRKKTGWDTYLPAEGLLIWHIDYDQAAWDNNTPNNYTGTTQTASSHMRVYLQPLYNSTSTPGSAFTTGTFTPTSWDGTDIKRAITNISKNSENVTFNVMGGANIPTISETGILNTFSTVQGTPSDSQVIYINAERLETDVQLSFVYNFHFEMKKESDPVTAWSKTLSIPQTDSMINNAKILIRYNPNEPSFGAIQNDFLVMTSLNAEKVQISLSGTSTRAVYVKPPVAVDPTSLNISSFVANWDPVFDATGYYLTVYNVSEGESEFTEGFDKGLVAPLDWIIKAGALTTSVNYSGKSIPAIQFKNSGEFIETENYILPIKNISFYIRSLAEVSGKLLVEAWNGTAWNTVDSISVNSTLNGINNYSFNAVNNYTRFRFTFTKGSGSVAIDDVTVKMFQNLEFNAREKWVTSTSDTLMNLVSARDYFYEVRASDKKLNPDSTIKYENITNFSNLIQAKTPENKSKSNVLIAYAKDGTVTIIVPETDVIINIYNIIGQRVRSITPNYNVVTITDLPRNQAYILQAGNRRTKIVL